MTAQSYPTEPDAGAVVRVTYPSEVSVEPGATYELIWERPAGCNTWTAATGTDDYEDWALVVDNAMRVEVATCWRDLLP